MTEKILILLPRQLGDVLLGTPLAQVLKQRIPTAKIDWWAHPLAKQILENNPFLENKFYYAVWDKKQAKNLYPNPIKRFLFWVKHFCSILSLFFKMRSNKYDVVIDAINYPRSTFVAMCLGVRKRISFRTGRFRDRFYTDLVDLNSMNQGYLGHTKIYLLKPLGIVLNEAEFMGIRPFLPISEENKIKPTLWIKEQFGPEIIEQSFFAMSPAQRSPRVANRAWPEPYYVECAFRIITVYNCPVVWLHGPGEYDIVHDMHEKLVQKLKSFGIDKVMSFVPPSMGLRESTFLVSFARGWLGNSNGMQHFATAVATKTLTIFGPNWPRNWVHPDTSKHFFIIRQTGCTKCSSNICLLPRRECLEDLSVDEVFESISQHFFSPNFSLDLRTKVSNMRSDDEL